VGAGDEHAAQLGHEATDGLVERRLGEAVGIGVGLRLRHAGVLVAEQHDLVVADDAGGFLELTQPDGGEVGVREDSTWDVPEPELAVLSNAHGEVVAFAIGNDMSSRSIEGENPLFLPQAKVYDRSCAIGPAAVLAWGVDVSRAKIRMTIDRAGTSVFDGTATVADMTREPAKLAAVLQGWGGPHLLPSYEIERRQVGERNVAASRYATLGRRRWRAAPAGVSSRVFGREAARRLPRPGVA